MANNGQYKPLNPNAAIKDGRLAGLCFFISKMFSNAQPNFREYIVEEDRENGHLVVQTKDGRRVICMVNSLYKGGWSLFRKAGTYNQDDLILMLGMSTREENDPLPRKMLAFRLSDVSTRVVNTKLGEREVSGFEMDKRDQWEQFACDFPEIGKSVRSVLEGSIDPDISNGPFRSHLTAILNGTAAPAAPRTEAQASMQSTVNDAPADDWDDSIPF